MKSTGASSDQEIKLDFVYNHHVVGFFDLLGQKELLQEIEGIIREDQTEFEKEKLQSILRQTVGTIRSFRKSFLDYFDAFSNHETQIQIPKEFENRFHQMRGHSKINLQSFSDSTVAWTSIYMKKEVDCAQMLNSIHGILIAVGMITPLYLSKKIPFRGGIDLEGGILLEPGGNEIYGPALNRAYFLECEVAKYPRVLVGKGLLDFFDHISSAQFQDIGVKKYCDNIIERCREWIVVDEDKLSMVHFLGPGAKVLIDNINVGKSFNRDVLKSAEDFILECEEKYKENKKLRDRYRSLKAYFDKYIFNWRN